MLGQIWRIVELVLGFILLWAVFLVIFMVAVGDRFTPPITAGLAILAIYLNVLLGAPASVSSPSCSIIPAAMWPHP